MLPTASTPLLPGTSTPLPLDAKRTDDVVQRGRIVSELLSSVAFAACLGLFIAAGWGKEFDYWHRSVVDYNIYKSVFDVWCVAAVQWSIATLLQFMAEDMFTLPALIAHILLALFMIVKAGLTLSYQGEYMAGQLFTYLLVIVELVCALAYVGVQGWFTFAVRRAAQRKRALQSINGEEAPAEPQGDAAVAENKKVKKVHLGRLIKLSYPERWLIIFATFCLFGSSVSTLAIPAFFGRIIETVSSTKSESALVNNVLALGVVFVIGALLTWLRGWLFTLSGQRLVARMRRDLFRAIARQEIGFFDTTRTGELTNRLASDTQVIQNAVTTNVSMVLRNAVTVIGGIVILFIVSWSLTLVMLAVVPIISFGAVLYGKYLRKLRKKFQDELANASTTAEEALSQIRTVRSFSREEFEIDRYGRDIDKSYQAGAKMAQAYGTFMGTATLAASAGMLLVLWYGGTLVIRGTITAGLLTSFLLYTLTVAFALATLTSLYGDFMSALGASERIFGLLDRVPEIATQGGNRLPQLQGIVELRRVTFTYPSRPEVTVLRDVSLAMELGKVLALVGPSGGGKSTIISLIERFYDVQEGSVLIDGQDIRGLDLKWLRRNIGLVSQEPVLFASSISDNIAYGSDGATPEAIIEAAKQANAHSFIESFPDKYNTMVGERGVRLSGGQKQRVAIARALLMNPRILLLDEATSALDAESEALVQEAIDRLMVGRTVLVIAHRLSTVRNASRVSVVDNGSIVESGTHEELLETNGVYKRLVWRQLQH